MRGLTRLVLLLSLAGTVLMATGCPETEVLTVDNGSLTIVVRNANPGSTRYEGISFRVVRVTFRPVDPDANANLGVGFPLSVVEFPVAVDFRNQDSKVVASTVVAAGSYSVESIVLQLIQLTDDNPPGVPATCYENFAMIPDQRFQNLSNLPTAALTGFAAPQFTVSASGTTLTIDVDVAVLAPAYENGFVCRDTPGATCATGSAPCHEPFPTDTNDQLFQTFVTTASTAFTLN